MYKAQACKFQLNGSTPYRNGIAILDIFNYANVLHIVDCENGNTIRAEELFDYNLVGGPLAYCDPGYAG